MSQTAAYRPCLAMQAHLDKVAAWSARQAKALPLQPASTIGALAYAQARVDQMYPCAHNNDFAAQILHTVQAGQERALAQGYPDFIAALAAEQWDDFEQWFNFCYPSCKPYEQ